MKTRDDLSLMLQEEKKAQLQAIKNTRQLLIEAYETNRQLNLQELDLSDDLRRCVNILTLSMDAFLSFKMSNWDLSTCEFIQAVRQDLQSSLKPEIFQQFDAALEERISLIQQVNELDRKSFFDEKERFEKAFIGLNDSIYLLSDGLCKTNLDLPSLGKCFDEFFAWVIKGFDLTIQLPPDFEQPFYELLGNIAGKREEKRYLQDLIMEQIILVKRKTGLYSQARSISDLDTQAQHSKVMIQVVEVLKEKVKKVEVKAKEFEEASTSSAERQQLGVLRENLVQTRETLPNFSRFFSKVINLQGKQGKANCL